MKANRSNQFIRPLLSNSHGHCGSRLVQASGACLLAISSAVLIFSPASAQTNVNWVEGNSNPTNRTLWGRGNNWSSGATPTGTGTVAVFDVATTQNPAAYGTALTIGGFSLTGGQDRSLVFTSTIALNQFGVDNSSAFNFSISGAGATTLAAAQTWSVTGTGNTTFSKSITNGGNLLTLEATSSGTGLIDSIISGTGGITKSGSGQWTLSGVNTHTGVTTISGGVLSVATIGNGGVAGNLGQATNAAANLVLGGGTLRYTGATATTDRNFTLSAGTTSSIDVTTNTLTMSGASAATTGALTKTGAGNLILSGANAHTGATTVSAGTLTLGASDRLSNSTAVSVTGGALALGAFNDTVASFAMSGGSLTGSGTLTAATYGLSGGTVSANLGAGTINSSGTVALNGTAAATAVNVTAGTLTLGATNLLSDSAAVSVTGGALALGAFNDTVASFAMSGGSLTGSGTLTAATYGLSGGTVSANLGAGTINSSGNVALNGTAGATAVNVTAGTLTLGATNRLNDSAAVTVSGGALALGAFNDTVASFAMSGGSLTGSGTLTAATYGLSGGTVSANLGAGTINSSGNVALNGTAAAGVVNVSSGALTLGSANRLSESAAINLTGGALRYAGAATTMNNNITVSGVSQLENAGSGLLSYGGTLTVNSGSLLVAGGSAGITFANAIAGNVNAVSATGLVNFAGGFEVKEGNNVTLGGNGQGSNVNVNGLSGNGNIVAAGGVSQSNLVVNIAGNGRSVFSGSIGGNTAEENNISFTKTGAGTKELRGNNTFTGVTRVQEGALVMNGSLASSSVVVDNGAVLGGSGTMANATLSGSGTVGPGNSPGITTVAQVDPSGGLDFAFEFNVANGMPEWNAPTASGNDVLRLTGNTAFTSSLEASNVIEIIIGIPLAAGQTFTGGFFTDNGADFTDLIKNATFAFYTGTASDKTLYEGPLTFEVSTVNILSADFEGGTAVTNGRSMQFTAVPESSVSLLGAMTSLLLLRRKRQKSSR